MTVPPHRWISDLELWEGTNETNDSGMKPCHACNEANARLIAELLEALKTIAAWRFDINGDCVADAMNVAQAAIRKAEGKKE